MKILKRLVYVLLMMPTSIIVFIIESLLLPVIITTIWILTGSVSLKMKVLKDVNRSMYTLLPR